jgi:hypothetical protein
MTEYKSDMVVLFGDGGKRRSPRGRKPAERGMLCLVKNLM